MLNSTIKTTTARQQALKDIAIECRKEKSKHNSPVVYAAREKMYTSIFKYLAKQESLISGQLILDI